MSQGSILYAHNHDPRLGDQSAKNRKNLHDPQIKCHRAQNHAWTYIVISKPPYESLLIVSKKAGTLLKIRISLKSMESCANSNSVFDGNQPLAHTNSQSG
jgi:hypothetical protein